MSRQRSAEQGGGRFGVGSQGAGKLAEFILYPSNAVTPAELDAYFCRKFGLTP